MVRRHTDKEITRTEIGKEDQLVQKIVQSLTDVLMYFRKEIQDSIGYRLDEYCGTIVSSKPEVVNKFRGSGGLTLVVQAKIQTVNLGEIDGGIVLKFAKDLQSEVKNANRLHEYLKIQQANFNKGNKYVSLLKYPETLFAPKVLGVWPEASCLALEFIPNGISLINSKYSPDEQLNLLGYSLGRLHGNESKKIEYRIYNPMFKVLEEFVASSYLDYWKNVLKESHGGVQYIHGDSHLHNVLLSLPRDRPPKIAWIDAILMSDADRMDDLGYSVSYLIQEELHNKLPKCKNIKEQKVISTALLQLYIYEKIPLLLSSYKVTTEIASLYKKSLPIDFFVGAHLILRARLFKDMMKDTLLSMGRYFIEKKPITIRVLDF